jgi:hypothetical protein
MKNKCIHRGSFLGKGAKTPWHFSKSTPLLPSNLQALWWGHDANAYVHELCMEWRRSTTRLSKSRGRSEANPVWVPKVEAQSNTSSSLVRSLGAAFTKNDAPVTYGVCFGRSFIWVEWEFHRACNGTDLRPKFVQSQGGSLKQVDV